MVDPRVSPGLAPPTWGQQGRGQGQNIADLALQGQGQGQPKYPNPGPARPLDSLWLHVAYLI
jgi:hypothetical protein